jgi:hypothetical protein
MIKKYEEFINPLNKTNDYVVYIGDGFQFFTKGKTYQVLKDHGSYYSIINDIGITSTPSKSSPDKKYFIPLREHNLNQILDK